MMTEATKSVLHQLRQATESRTEYSDGSLWGQVYLPNVGGSHALAGHLSVLKKAGYYRTLDGAYFGEVLIRGE